MFVFTDSSRSGLRKAAPKAAGGRVTFAARRAREPLPYGDRSTGDASLIHTANELARAVLDRAGVDPIASAIQVEDAAVHPRWYALTVRHQHECLTQTALRSKGLETLVPTYRARRQWSDRVKELDLPLFSGYVFCRFVHTERMEVLDTPGVAKIVGFGAYHAPVDDQEIAAIQTVMSSKFAVRPWPHLKPGDRVRVERGPLRGIEGTLLREKDGIRLVIGVELLSRSVAVDMEPDMIAPARLFHAASA